MLSNLQDDSLEKDDEGSFSASPSDIETDGPVEEGSIESMRRFFAETLGLGLLTNISKTKPPPKIVGFFFLNFKECFSKDLSFLRT